MQLLLLVLGVTLLAIAAGFYLIYAWFTFDTLWRAVSTVAVTLIAVAGASWLRRAQLKAAAEGVAALATALLVLDVWAIPALGMFELDRVDQALFWGGALIALAAVFEAWSRVTALRFPAIGASLAIVPGVGLLAAGLAGLAGDGASRFAIGAVGAAFGALIHLAWQRRSREAVESTSTKRRLLPFADVLRQASAMDRTPEIVIVAIAGMLASVVGLVALVLPLSSDSLDVVRPVALVALAIASAAQALLIPSHPQPIWLGGLAVPFAPIATVALLAAPVALDASGMPTQIWTATAAALALALPAGLDRLRARAAASPKRAHRASVVAALITSLAGLGVLFIATVVNNSPIVMAIAWRAFAEDDYGPLAPVLESFTLPTADGLAIGIIAGLAIAGVLAATPAARRVRIAPFWAGASVVGLTFASWQLRAPMLVQAALIVCLSLVVAALILTSPSRNIAMRTRALRVVLWIGLVYTAAQLLAIGAMHAGHQLTSSIAIVVALFAARFAVPPTAIAGGSTSAVEAAGDQTTPVRVALTTVASLTALGSAIVVPLVWTVDFAVDLPLASTFAVMLSGAALTAIAALLPRRALAGTERVAMVVCAAYPAIVADIIATIAISSVPDGAIAGGLPQPITFIVASLVFAATVIAGVVAPGQARNWLLSIAALAVWSPLVGAVVVVAGLVGVGPEPVFVHGREATIVLVAVAAASAVLSLVARRRRGVGSTLWLVDIPALTLAAFAVAGFAVQYIVDGGISWSIGLLLAATTALVAATSADGLIASRQGRQHVGWAAIPLACLAWLAFVGTLPEPQPVEVWWLPVGGIIAAAGSMVWWFGRHVRGGRPAVIGPILIAVGVLAACLPVAVVGAAGDSPVRSIAVGSSAAVALLASASVRWNRALTDLPTPTMAALAFVVAATACLRAVVDPQPGIDEFHSFIWIAPAVLVVAAAVVLALRNGRLPAGAVVPTAVLAVLCVFALMATLADVVRTGPGGAALTAAALVAITVALPPVAQFRPAMHAIIPAAALFACGLGAFATARPARFDRPLDLVLATVALAIVVLALGVAVWRLGRDAPSWRMATIGVLPFAAWALVAVVLAQTGASNAGPLEGGGSIPVSATAGVIAITMTAFMAAVDAGISADGRRRFRLLRASGDVSAVLVALGGVVAGGSTALTWTLVAVTLIVASLVRQPVTEVERMIRSIARWVGTPVLAITAGIAVRDAWPEATASSALLAAGATLFVVGVGVALASRGSSDQRGRHSVEALTELGAGGLVGIVGSVLVDAVEPDAITAHLSVAIVSALVLALWSVRILPRGLAFYSLAVAAPAGLALALIPVLRTLANVSRTDGPDRPWAAFAPELWGLPVLLILVGAATVATARARALAAEAPETASAEGPLARRIDLLVTRGLVAAGVASVTLAALGGIEDGPWWRSTLWICVLAALALTAHARRSLPFDRVTMIVAACGVALVALVALATGAFERVEQITAPVGATVLVFGAILLARSPQARSWPVVSPGIAILLVPSFLAQFADAPLWRIVGVGLVAVGALVWGLVAKLQAPFLLGLAFTIGQTITAFWIALDAANRDVPWWIWLAIAGLVLLLLAIRFEASMRDARKTVATIAGMR